MNLAKPQSRQFVIIVTGISGAGRSTAIKSLEDLNLFCIDNLPIRLIWQAVDFVKASSIKCNGFAFGMDNRDDLFTKEFPFIKRELKRQLQVDVIFLEADAEAIVDRYSATRRKHPLDNGEIKLIDAIQQEIELLQPIRLESDFVIDTSNLNPTELTRCLEQRYLGKIPERQLRVSIQSFGFKYGIPRNADTIFDVRFLKNPNFVEALREKSGLDTEVKRFLLEQSETREFLQKLEDWLLFLLPKYYAEGKHYLRIGIGCTGGMHRSVGLSDEIAKRLLKAGLQNMPVNVVHRDLHAGGKSSKANSQDS
jgi:UPF0042 nucleotide-binding protein